MKKSKTSPRESISEQGRGSFAPASAASSGRDHQRAQFGAREADRQNARGAPYERGGQAPMQSQHYGRGDEKKTGPAEGRSRAPKTH